MKTSEQINEICAALALAQQEYKPVTKNKHNKFLDSWYADLSSVLEATREALYKNGLALPQSPMFKENRVIVISRLIHKSGQWIESELSIKPKNDTAQDIGSAITYARRYSAEALLGVSSEDDDDGNSAMGSSVKKKEEPKKEEPKNIFDKNDIEAKARLSIFLEKNNIAQDSKEDFFKKLHGKELNQKNLQSILREFQYEV